jgi:hypothetical protein
MQICIFVEHANSAMCVECSSSHRELFNSLSLGKKKEKRKKKKVMVQLNSTQLAIVGLRWHRTVILPLPGAGGSRWIKVGAGEVVAAL